MRLFQLLTDADSLIAQIRSRPAAPAPAPLAHQPMPRADSGPAGRRGLRLSLVPKLLLGLGALCVLVAAALFLPFAWELLGVVGRTVVLILLTVAAGFGAHAAGTRSLRATSEALGVVALGLLAFDLLGARSAGWLDAPSGPGFAALVGGVLISAGTAMTLWLRRTRVAAFVGGEVAAGLGSLVLLMGVAAQQWGTAGQRLAVVVPIIGALTVASARLRRPGPGPRSMQVATLAHGVVALVSWLALVLAGLGALVDVGLGDGALTWTSLWPTGAGLTLVLAGLYAAVPAAVGSLAQGVRVAALATAVLPWTVALTAPAYDEGPDARLLAVLAVLLAGLAVTQVAPRPWRNAAVPTGAVAAIAVSALVAPLAVTAVATFAETAVPTWAGSPGGRAVPSVGADDLGSPWLLPLVVAALSLSVLLLARSERAELELRPYAALAAALLLLAVVGALLLLGALVWILLGILLVGAAGAGLLAWVGPRWEWHVIAVSLAAVALVLSWYDEVLTLAAVLTLLVVASLHHARGPVPARQVAGLLLGPLLAGAWWAGGAIIDAPPEWTALGALLVLGAGLLARGLLEERTGIGGVEVGTALAALATAALGLDRAPQVQALTWLAVYLTVAGTVATVAALTRPDRRWLGWLGGVLLAGATWARLGDVGVTTPEAYTLPAAVALLVTGWWHTRRDLTASTLAAWGPGMALALTPSLLWSLADPLSWRALILGAACLALVLVGAGQRLAAPLVWGSAVGATLVLWEVVPPAFEMSAWLVIGVAGAALLIIGASWDARLRDTRTAWGYVRRLR